MGGSGVAGGADSRDAGPGSRGTGSRGVGTGSRDAAPSGPADPVRYELWRQDDNGNRYLVSVHASRADADAALEDLERGVVHKQLYYVREHGVSR